MKIFAIILSVWFVAALGSAFSYAFLNFPWWAEPLPEQSARAFVVVMFHLLGFIAGPMAAHAWSET